MSKPTRDRIMKFLHERAAMRGIDQSEVAAVHRGEEGREAILTTADLRNLVAENERLTDALSLLRDNSSLSVHQLEIINNALFG